MWRIYYSDGSTFSSEDGAPEDAPGWGVVVIPQTDQDVGRMMMAHWDHYCWHEDQWWGHDIVGLLDCLAMPGSNVVVHGRTVGQEIFKKIWVIAEEDSDFEPKSASLSIEMRGR
jgi:hypothetical protein